MKQNFKNILFLALLLLSTSVFAGNTFDSEDARCAITFPGEYDTENTEEGGVKSISVTGIHGSMIYMLIVTVYEKDVVEEENDLNEIITLINFANQTSSKIKIKKIKTFNVAGQQGFFGFIKPKLGEQKYRGNYYVIIKGNIMYQFTALGVKKGYDERMANRFADSFKFH